MEQAEGLGRKMKQTKIAFAASILLLLIGLAAFLILSDQPEFTEERIKNPASYILDIQQMNGADSHTLNLTAGNVLQVAFETEKGSLHMEITAPDGTILYTGNGEDVTEFEIILSQTGLCAITVEARTRHAPVLHKLDSYRR